MSARNGRKNGHANGHKNGHPGRFVIPIVDENGPLWDLRREGEVLGAILIDGSVFRAVREVLPDPEAFFRDDHQQVYRAMIAVDDGGAPVTAGLVEAELDRRGVLSRIGGIEALGELALAAPHAVDARFHAAIVREKFELRRLEEAALQLRADIRSRDFTAAQVRERARLSLRGPEEQEAGYVPRNWPEPIGPEAYHGIVGDVMRTIAPHTEADPAPVLVQFLVVMGNLLGPRLFSVVENTRHGLNEYAAVVGNSSKARKGTSMQNTLAFMEAVDSAYVANQIVEGLISGEGLIDQVRDAAVTAEGMVAGAEDKRLMVVESEFGSTLGIMNREGNSLSGVIRRGWDSGNLRTLSRRRNQVATTGAHISIIGHITNEELERRLTNVDAANGFANRFLWACARRSKFLPEGGAVDRGQVEAISLRIRGIAEWARDRDIQFHRTPRASKLWRACYARLSEPRAGMLGAVTSRAEAHVLRLSTIYAALDVTCMVDEEHLAAALAVWRYCVDSAAYIFGRSLGDPDAERLLAALRAAGPEGLSRTDIRDLFGRHKSAEQIGDVLDRLATRGLARHESRPTGGRPVERWHAVSPLPSED